jgi:structural maintenance of chromosome 1
VTNCQLPSYRPAPFFILDEVDAALDNLNVSRMATFLRSKVLGNDKLQLILISLKSSLYETSDSLIGVYRNNETNSSNVLTLRLTDYSNRT